MTPQREEAERFMRLAKRDQAAFAALLNAANVDPAVACFLTSEGNKRINLSLISKATLTSLLSL